MLLHSFRAFGTAPEDLDVDFTAPGPHVVTVLLSRCAEPAAAPDACWALPAGERVARLLAIATATGVAALEVAPRCAGCATRLDVALPLADLLALHESRPGAVQVRLGEATLRMATGADQAAWWEAGYGADDDALNGMLATLLADAGEGVGELDLARADDALAALEPLVAFRAELKCPECGLPQVLPVDLQALVLAALQGTQRSLIEDVHSIARAYHWTENLVLALPLWRRDRYLALIERQEGP